MYARLGFAIAAHVDPDILLVDEVLAVGDHAFQMKCYARMDELRKRWHVTYFRFAQHGGSAPRL
jgi:ABC-2 type transport system ATP-binding protein